MVREVTGLVFMVKFTYPEPAGTVTEGGAVAAGLSVDKETAMPPAGALPNFQALCFDHDPTVPGVGSWPINKKSPQGKSSQRNLGKKNFDSRMPYPSPLECALTKTRGRTSAVAATVAFSAGSPNNERVAQAEVVSGAVEYLKLITEN